MDRAIKRYLSEIGRRGGLKSRRVLPTEAAKEMVRLREARKAFARFRTSCFWCFDPDRRIQTADIPWVAEQLRKHGGREAWLVADRLCR